MWCEAPEISFIKYNKTLTFYNTTAFPFLTIDLAQTNDGTGSVDRMRDYSPRVTPHRVSDREGQRAQSTSTSEQLHSP